QPRQDRAEVPQQVRRTLHVHDLLALLVAYVVLLADPQHLLAQQEHVAIEGGVGLGRRRHGHRRPRDAVLAAALRALDQPSGEFVLELERRPALTHDAHGHGDSPWARLACPNLWLDSRLVSGRFAGPPGGVASCVVAPSPSSLSPSDSSSPLSRPRARRPRRPPPNVRRSSSRPAASSTVAPTRYKRTSGSSSTATASPPSGRSRRCRRRPRTPPSSTSRR